jgi:hypothetical protein
VGHVRVKQERKERVRNQDARSRGVQGMNWEGLSRVAHGVVLVARVREAGICQHTPRVPDVCRKNGKSANPRCTTKGIARNKWERFSSVVGLIYLFKLSLIKLSL